MWRPAGLVLAGAMLLGACGGDAERAGSSTTTRLIETSTTTTTTPPVDSGDPAESAFTTELERRLGFPVGASEIELARAVCTMLDEARLSDRDALAALFRSIEEEAEQVEAALIFTIGSEQFCPQHTGAIDSFVADQGIELPS